MLLQVLGISSVPMGNANVTMLVYNAGGYISIHGLLVEIELKF